jgi:drug/metabolite transporter (DMT)-like permease
MRTARLVKVVMGFSKSQHPAMKSQHPLRLQSIPMPSHNRLTLSTTALLLVPPLMWAGNAVVGRLMQGVVPPLTLNFLRWALALVILLPWAAHVLKPSSPLWPQARHFALLGLLGMGLYNALQYMALQTSTPVNVTLVAASTPVWMLLLGHWFYGVHITLRASLGAALSLLGVAVVLGRGDASVLMGLQLVPGDALMLLAAGVWAWYSWLLAKPPPGSGSAELRGSWSAFLMAQMALGVLWSGALSGIEWMALPALPEGQSHLVWGWPLVLGLLFVAVGPSLLAYRCWGAGVARVGPSVAGFFANLTPLFAALLSTLLLGEPPQLYHAAGFVLIVGGIGVSARR